MDSRAIAKPLHKKGQWPYNRFHNAEEMAALIKSSSNGDFAYECRPPTTIDEMPAAIREPFDVKAELASGWYGPLSKSFLLLLGDPRHPGGITVPLPLATKIGIRRFNALKPGSALKLGTGDAKCLDVVVPSGEEVYPTLEQWLVLFRFYWLQSQAPSDIDGVLTAEAMQFVGVDCPDDLFAGVADYFPNVRAGYLRTSELQYLANCATSTNIPMPAAEKFITTVLGFRLSGKSPNEVREMLGWVNDFDCEHGWEVLKPKA